MIHYFGFKIFVSFILSSPPMHKICKEQISTQTHMHACAHTYRHYTHNTVCCVKCFGWSNTDTHTCFYNLVFISQGINSLCIGITHALRAAILPHIHTLLSQAFHFNFWQYLCVFHINFLKSPCGLNPPLSYLKQYTTQGQMSSS